MLIEIGIAVQRGVEVDIAMQMCVQIVTAVQMSLEEDIAVQMLCDEIDIAVQMSAGIYIVVHVYQACIQQGCLCTTTTRGETYLL